MLKSTLAIQAIIHEYEPSKLPVPSHDWIDSLDKMLGDLQFTCSVGIKILILKLIYLG